uniref:Uncharacterized protein n=1 Tax=Anguilla anguilla TaxID=7936 RepID=A0A0E9PMY8_ANGAN
MYFRTAPKTIILTLPCNLAHQSPNSTDTCKYLALT